MSHKKFVFLFIYTSLLILIVVSPFIVFLIKTKEYATVHEIVNEQIQKKSIYGTALNNNTFLYKMELINQIRPNIVAIGSSRIMQLREEFFLDSFINTGGAVNKIEDGSIVLNQILKIYKSKIIIFAVDPWWFNENYKAVISENRNLDTTNILFFEKIFNPIKWLIKCKIDLKQFINVLFFNNYKNNITNYNNIGISALDSSSGFRKDGSYFYSSIIFAKDNSKDIKFSDTISRIEKGNRRFEYGSKISKKSINEFKNILDICKKNNIKLILFIPPVSQTTYKKLNEYKKNYRYIDEFRHKITEFGGYDYHNPSLFDSNDCEFIDGFHGGDVTYQRILLDLSKKDDIIKNIINIKELQKNINEFKGRSTTIDNTSISKEVDFLELECKK
jgi:hypothetical protein